MTRLQCPNCQKGLLWGIFLDIPPEMKSGTAEWVACEPPEHDVLVKCPSCGEQTATYGELYAASADDRRLEKNQKRADQLQLVRVEELPAFRLIGYVATGNPQRESFLKECWETLATFVQTLKKNRLFPRFAAESAPLPSAIGLRMDDPDEVGITQCRYLAATPLPADPDKTDEKLQNRLANPEYEDPKNIRIQNLPAGLYAQYSFQGRAEDFFQIPKFLKKDWLATHDFELRQGPVLEIYTKPLTTWPPEKEEEINAVLCMPVQPKTDPEIFSEENL